MERLDQSANSDGVVWLLLSYLYTHPDAKDTTAGITNWWLRAYGVSERDVKKALTDLVARDWLIRRGSLSGRQIYSLNQARRAELQQLLESRK